MASAIHLGCHSQHHAPCCLREIFRGEAIRHMVNCSRSVDYDAHVSELRATLKMRGYPDEWLPHVPYNADTRQSYLDRYARRRHRSPRQRQDILALKVRYCSAVHQLALKSKADALITHLKAQLGDSFLAGSRLVVAYKAQRTSFLSHYKMNFCRGEER